MPCSSYVVLLPCAMLPMCEFNEFSPAAIAHVFHYAIENVFSVPDGNERNSNALGIPDIGLAP